MKRYTLFSVLVVAAFALAAAVIAPAASALPQLLPLPAGGSHWSGANDEANPILETTKKEVIECKTATGEGGQETDTLGTFRITFRGCKEPTLRVGCNTVGDATEVILSNGSYHYVVDSLGATLGANGVAILFLPSATEFECTAAAVFKVTGQLLCLLLEPLVSMKTHLFHCIQSTGVQNVTSYYNDNGSLVTGVFLLNKKGTGTAIQSGELALATVGFIEPVAIMNE